MNRKEIRCLVELIFAFTVYPLVVMLLWNWLMPDFFGLTEIAFGQSVGVYWLCNVLFKPNSVSIISDCSGDE